MILGVRFFILPLHPGGFAAWRETLLSLPACRKLIKRGGFSRKDAKTLKVPVSGSRSVPSSSTFFSRRFRGQAGTKSPRGNPLRLMLLGVKVFPLSLDPGGFAAWRETLLQALVSRMLSFGVRPQVNKTGIDGPHTENTGELPRWMGWLLSNMGCLLCKMGWLACRMGGRLKRVYRMSYGVFREGKRGKRLRK